MYIIKDDFFKEENLKKVKVTEDIIRLSNIFRKEIDFDKLPVRAANLLKENQCETIGDAYFFITENLSDVGQRTREEIIFHILYALMPCKKAIETQKAFYLSGQPMEDKCKIHYYELSYFHDRKNNGSYYLKTELDLNAYMDEDAFLQELVDRDELYYMETDYIAKINEIDEETYICLTGSQD